MSRLAGTSTSALIPRAFIDELLIRTDLVELIGSYLRLKKQGRSHIACCPFHNEKTPSFNVIEKKQFYHCFGCGANGNAISFVMDYLNQGFVEAVKTLASRLGMQVPREDNPKETQEALNAYQLLEKVSHYYRKNLKDNGFEAIQYLQQRGLSGEIAKHFQLGFASKDWHALENRFKPHLKELISTGMLVEKDNGKPYDRYRERIMFPIHDRQGRIIGFGGRAIHALQKPKYLNSPETSLFQKNRELYGLHQVLQMPKEAAQSLLIVEGYLDVIALAQHGIPNVVATLGTATSAYHIQLLSKHFSEVIFCFDGDAAGKKAAWRALETSLPYLENNLDLRFMFLPEEHDPDSLVRAHGKEAFLAEMSKAISLDKYLLDVLKMDLDLQSLVGKNRLINKAKPLLKNMPEGSYKQLIINEIARVTRLENQRIQMMLGPLQNPDLPKPSASQSAKISPLRYAIALLLQNPSIYADCQSAIAQEILDGKGQEVLLDLCAILKNSPESNTAALVEFWRDTPLFDVLGKLASRNIIVPKEGIIKEFLDTIRLLNKRNLENKIKDYLAKLEKQGLSPAEKHVLKDLLQKKHEIA